VRVAEAKGWTGIVAGTRKTTPGLMFMLMHPLTVSGFRVVEKYAMKGVLL
jgi:hypothetical protein